MSTVILIHGAGGDHTVWRYQTAWLADSGFDVTAIDLPGHGSNEEPALGSIEDMAGWLVESVSAQGAVTMVGHSMGSLVVLEAAISCPDLTAGAVLVGAAATMGVNPDLLHASDHDLAVAAGLIAKWSLPRSGKEMLADEAEVTAEMIGRSRPGVLATDLRACAAYEGAARAPTITTRTTLVSGDEDRMTPLGGAGELADAIPGAELVVIEGAGHEPMIQAPDDFNRVLAGFVASIG